MSQPDLRPASRAGAEAPEKSWSSAPKPSIPTSFAASSSEARAFEPIYYFFSGTLTKPDILRGVLGLEEDPVLRDAKVYGYELANWGQYKALVDGKSGAAVTGRASVVQSAEAEFKLAHYETAAYKVVSCDIHFADGPGEGDGETVVGKTFRYAGDAEALKQGRFDRKLWELQMGRRLPPQWHGGATRDIEQTEGIQAGAMKR